MPVNIINIDQINAIRTYINKLENVNINILKLHNQIEIDMYLEKI